ncbi:hypothetical protein [Comamonas endophytica]|uniref:Ferritin-like metal-binding protein YciE n=1 Tax=Comamonas endophytica TaxID=2949090 RepID=A0ABY6G6P0_9BURK|nr:MULTISPECIES: hypothetical protein [unclassified Acidovorax]MCD2511290.1 hypothetical protein [Acidovorax sp. D4N7]UYG50684.1 hypothetical protein M9799_11330 [Acidovorax sp. 5MLIR]
MAHPSYDATQLKDLLLQMLETELAGEQVYKKAITVARNPDLKKEWQEYLAQTQNHYNVLRTLCEDLGIDAGGRSAGRDVAKHIGNALVQTIELAVGSGTAQAAELIACECVVHAETKDHANWELLGQVAAVASGEQAKLLKDAYARVEQDEDHHLYHSQGWCRELSLQGLGMPAVLPPPEEVRNVATATEAARAGQQRRSML